MHCAWEATGPVIRRGPAGTDRHADCPVTVALTWFPLTYGLDAGWRLVIQA